MQPDTEKVDEVDVADEAFGYDFLEDGDECYIIDSSVPYQLKLKKNLLVKTNILINGFIPPAAQRFSIDLCSYFWNKFRLKKIKDIVFHFNPRFNQNCIVRNSYVNEEWGAEEVHASKKNPFKRGQMFIMEIYVLKHEYLVSVNGVHFCSYAHRVNPSTVDSIYISGDIQLLKVELSEREMYPSTECALFLEDGSHDKLKFPFFHEFKYPLMEKWDLTIIGTPHNNAERFAIDFCGICNKCCKDHKNIIFHINPRLIQNYVARNSFIHDQWGIEESNAIRKSPFKRGETFTLEFFVLKDQFLMSVNGEHFCCFHHRMPPSAIDSFEISGDIVLKRIEVGLKNSYPANQISLYPDLNLVLEEYSVPFSYHLPNPLSVNTIIEINGRVLLLPHEFYINLQSSSFFYPHPLIPYHLSMRWRPLTSDTTVVNSWTGQWDDEIILPSLLRPNSNFTITIYAKKEGLSTVIKAPIKPYSTVLPLFVCKAELDLINTLHIQGDVQIHSINVKKV